MYNFKAYSWFDGPVRGRIASIEGCELEKYPELWNPGILLSETVQVDNKEYLVTGVETFKMAISPDKPYNSTFGLALKSV